MVRRMQSYRTRLSRLANLRRPSGWTRNDLRSAFTPTPLVPAHHCPSINSQSHRGSRTMLLALTITLTTSPIRPVAAL
jgi:hypothetical protein